MTGSNIAVPPLMASSSRAAATAPAVGVWAWALTAARQHNAAAIAHRENDLRSMDTPPPAGSCLDDPHPIGAGDDGNPHQADEQPMLHHAGDRVEMHRQRGR